MRPYFSLSTSGPLDEKARSRAGASKTAWDFWGGLRPLCASRTVIDDEIPIKAACSAACHSEYALRHWKTGHTVAR